LSWKKGEKPTSPVIVVPTVNWGDDDISPTAIVVPTVNWGGTAAIDTPKKPNQPTATPAKSGFSDPTMYDDFAGSGIDATLWDADQSFANIVVRDGNLGLGSNILGAKKMGEVNITKPYFVESRFRTARGGGLVMYVWYQNGQTVCQTYEVNSKMHLFCKVFVGEKEIVVSDQIVDQESWNIVRVDIEPSPLKFTFFANGVSTGSYKTDNTNSRISFGLGSWCKETNCYFDYVRIGAIEDDPTIYDNFNDSTYDGKFDTTKWSYEQRDAEGSSVQQDGVFVLTQGGIEKSQTLRAVKYWPFKLQYSCRVS
jgi:hypothetical protein